MKIKEKSLENLNEALDLLRKKLDTVISKLIILIETIYYKWGK